VILLGLDTCTAEQSLAVAERGRLLGSARLAPGGRHSQTLLPAMARLLEEAGVSTGDLAAFAVTTGPGNFTGLRVGLATAQGMALASGRPLAGFSTLRVMAEALAESVSAAPGTEICALVEAGRGQVYRGLYSVERRAGSGWLTAQEGEERLVDPHEALEGLQRGAVAGGEGLELVMAGGAASGLEDIRLVATPLPLAPVLAARASEMLAAGNLPTGRLTPNYLRPPAARAANP